MRPLIRRYKKQEPFIALMTWRYEEDHEGKDKFFCLFFRFTIWRIGWGPHLLFLWFGKTSWRSRRRFRIIMSRAKLIWLEGYPYYVEGYPYYAKAAAEELGLPHQTQWQAVRALLKHEKEVAHADT